MLKGKLNDIRSTLALFLYLSLYEHKSAATCDFTYMYNWVACGAAVNIASNIRYVEQTPLANNLCVMILQCVHSRFIHTNIYGTRCLLRCVSLNVRAVITHHYTYSWNRIVYFAYRIYTCIFSLCSLSTDCFAQAIRFRSHANEESEWYIIVDTLSLE